MLRSSLVWAIIIALGTQVQAQTADTRSQKNDKITLFPNKENKDREQWYRQMEELEYLQTHDPNIGTVPKERLIKRIEQLCLEEYSNNSSAKVQAPSTADKWIELGPV